MKKPLKYIFTTHQHVNLKTNQTLCQNCQLIKSIEPLMDYIVHKVSNLLRDELTAVTNQYSNKNASLIDTAKYWEE